MYQLPEQRVGATLEVIRKHPRGECPGARGCPGNPVRIDLRPNMSRTIADAEPGSYRVAVSPSESDHTYTLTVQECGVPEVA